MNRELPFLPLALALSVLGCAPMKTPVEPAGTVTPGATPATGTPGAQPANAPPPVSAARRLLKNAPADAARPRFSPDGKRVAFHAGPEGSRKVYVAELASGSVQAVVTPEGDSRDPSWDATGARVVYANNAQGSYDLYVSPLSGGAPEQVTRFPGDELEPTVASVPFAFFAVHHNDCGAGARGVEVDGYEKIAFTRREAQPAREEVWFVSLRPAAVYTQQKRSAHGTHTGRVSAEGSACREPQFSRDGLSLVWSCSDGLHDGAARWDLTFVDALKAVKGQGPEVCNSSSDKFDEPRCMTRLKKRYASYVGEPSAAGAGLARPSVSANQIELVADQAGKPVHRARDEASAAWQAFAGEAGEDAQNVVWAPDGKSIAFDARGEGGRTLYALDTGSYLQEVANLNEFPELYGKGQSERLHGQRFVVRSGTNKEFYALHEQLRYQRRPQFVTADAALQAYRDEMLRSMQAAEERASRTLRVVTRALFERYLARTELSADDRYLAVLFGTAWAVLEAAARIEQPTPEDYYTRASGEFDEALAARLEELTRPPVERLPGQLKGVLARLPTKVRSDIQEHVDDMLAHAELKQLPVPGRDKPVRVDFTQFAVRGPYAESKLVGYFLAVSWLAQAPLPITPALPELLTFMESTRIKERTLYDLYRSVDTLISAFMGRPVDATLEHVRAVREASPGLLQPFQAAEVEKQLLTLRGPMPIRDADAALSREHGRALYVTLLPKRAGYDTIVFRAITDDATRIPWPSALEPFAAVGDERARSHARAALPDELQAAYDGAMAKLRAEQPMPGKGFYGTDIYHSWFAALAALAVLNDVPSESLLTFAKSDAWHDRRLASALGGYTQLKHAATLYNMQDNSAECDSEVQYSVLTEQPVLPLPQGYVDPAPRFFEALGALAQRIYREIDGDPKGPAVPYYGDGEGALNARNFALQLAAIARDELSGKPLTPVQARWIESVGEKLESLTLTNTRNASMPVGGEARARRGIAIATDIHTNAQRGGALEIAIGRIDDLYVAVPSEVGQRIAQGGVFSFYEFVQPMADRLTDEKWGERLEKGALPPRPAWTESFLEPQVQ